MTLAQALARAAALGLARLDAQLLLLHSLGRAAQDRAWLLAHDNDALDEAQAARFMALCERRTGGEPVAYLTGQKEFYGLSLQVDPRVLIPRPDTETLVDWALELLGFADPRRQPADRPGHSRHLLRRLAASEAHPSSPRIIDLGTGSGAIALAIKKMRPDAHVEAVDRSLGALAVAAANAAALALQIEFRQASWLEGATETYDLIVGNPPYVATHDPHLADLRHEPLSALEAGPDGLDAIRAILTQAPGRLHPGGWLLLEHGWDQAEAVRGLLAAAGLRQVQSRRDLAGIQRCSGGQRVELG